MLGRMEEFTERLSAYILQYYFLRNILNFRLFPLPLTIYKEVPIQTWILTLG